MRASAKASTKALPPLPSLLDVDAALIRADLLHLTSLASPYQAGWFHRHLAAELARVSREAALGLAPRLILSVPPRHGKTRLLQALAAWHLGHHPHHDVVGASYGQDVANESSRRIRDLTRLPAFRAAFPVFSVRADVDGATLWTTTQGGAYKATGVSGPLLGRGAHLLIIDDPHKSEVEGLSRHHTGKVWEWWMARAQTRLAPGGGVVVCHQRWSQHDLAGRLEAAEGERWRIIRYPALAEEDEPHRKKGEALHPERYDAATLMRWRDGEGGRGGMPRALWAAVYQQRPGLSDGMWRRSWLRVVPLSAIPRGLHWVRFWDLAASSKASADRTASLAAALGPDGTLYLADGIAFREQWPEARRIIAQTARAEAHVRAVHVEAIAAWQTATDDLRSLPELAHVSVHPVRYPPGAADKVSRWGPFCARAEGGRVVCVEGGWINDFASEWESFPAGAHDDCVDAASGALFVLGSADTGWLTHMLNGSRR